MRTVPFALGLAVVLSGCSTTSQDNFRDPQVPMGASTRFDARSFAGRWLVVGSFDDARRGVIEVTYDEATQTIAIGGDAVAAVAGTYRVGVPGELLPLDRTQESLIVMWVDEAFETAAIGVPSGRFGALIDRDGNVPKDRARAARDVFDFYGWKTDVLQRTT